MIRELLYNPEFWRQVIIPLGIAVVAIGALVLLVITWIQKRAENKIEESIPFMDRSGIRVANLKALKEKHDRKTGKIGKRMVQGD
ncbi:hypothetical protein ACFL08_01420 [Patescibacteria group bacterium]